MTTLLAIAFLLTTAAAPGVAAAHGIAPLWRDVIYCQPPSFSLAVNASTAYGSEIADDIPDSLIGRSIGEVTLYVTEWGYAEWVEPLGLVIRFYDGACPPPLEPAVTYNLPWNELMTSLEVMTPPTRIVYSATAALPYPITVTPGMSLGAYVVTDWPQQPYAGLTLTEPGEYYGCGESYWDYAAHGAPRWTPLSSATGIEADLAYCLAEAGTGIQVEEATSWGRVKSLFR
ncbi:MAG: hypothetical protein ABIK85_10630 [Candidatus Eisenbacteria bacterium]